MTSTSQSSSQDDPSQSTTPPHDRGALPGDELLPPVEPPDARFLVQLFVVPLVIVATIALVLAGLLALVNKGQNIDEIVRTLGSSSQARFQRAEDLANMLRQPNQYPELKTSRELAQKLGELLEEQIAAGDGAEAAVTMRFFLCTALGEFHVDDGLPSLVKAAREDPDRDVRRRAINAIAVLVGELAQLKPPRHVTSREMSEALVALADDEDELIRSETAFALGVAASVPGADPRLTEKLETLADDPYTDARFNAALGLARLGTPEAAAGLAEMLDPSSIASSVSGEKAMSAGVTEEQLRRQKAYKRDMIIGNALSAIDRLAEQQLDLSARERLEQAVADFLEAAPQIETPAPVPKAIIDAAERTLAGLRQSQ